MALFARLVATGTGLLFDSDTGYHIRAGEHILTTRTIPDRDPFSHIAPALPWTAHEWLPEILMALAHENLGLTGVVVLTAGVLAGTYALLLARLAELRASVLLVTGVMALVMLTSQIHWLARPHVFSLLLFVLWSTTLDRFDRERVLPWFTLPLLMLLWVNLHGGFIVGFLVLAAHLGANIVIALTGPAAEDAVAKLRRLVPISALCVLVTGLNPFGYGILLFPFRLINDRFLMDNVREFLSPNFHGVMPFRYMLFALMAGFAVSRSVRLVEVVLAVGFTHMALYSLRHVTLFAFVAAPFIARYGREGIERSLPSLPPRFRVLGTPMSRVTSWHLWPVTVVALVTLLAAAGHISIGFDDSVQPVGAARFIAQERIPGRLFASDEFGDYLIYALWPRQRVFIDGRNDMYGREIVLDYATVADVRPGWEAVLDRYGITWAVTSRAMPLTPALLADPDWRLVYVDKVAHIFLKNVPANRPLIEKHALPVRR